MSRPLPIQPRGPRRRRRRPVPAELLLGVPRVAPDWQLRAALALMKPKPHTKRAVAHGNGEQPWTGAMAARLADALDASEQRLGYRPEAHRPDFGEYHVLFRVAPSDQPRAMAFAVLLSALLPATWLTFGRLALLDGRFYRRERGFRLNLVPATDVHLPRELRAAIRPSLPKTSPRVASHKARPVRRSQRDRDALWALATEDAGVRVPP